MALEGSIKDFSLADIFQLIGIQRKTGVLTMKRKDEEVKVSFLNGMVVNADSKSGRVDDRLGSVLVKTAKLTNEQLKSALKTQKQTLKKLGHVLLESGLVRPEDLREALGIQITQIVYRLFRWQDGDYHFEQDVKVDYDKENFAPMSAESILMEGMRMIDEWPVIERKITSFAMVFERVGLETGQEPLIDDVRAEEPEDGGDDDFDLIFGGDEKSAGSEPSSGIRLSREEGLVYQQVDGKRSVQELVERIMLSEFEICRALYDLLNRNLVVSVQPQKKRSKGKPTKSGSPALAAASSKLAPVIVGAVAVIVQGLGMTSLNPLNLLAGRSVRHERLEALRQASAVTRLQRVAEAIDLYVLMKDTPLSAAADLVASGLLTEADLQDPWGRPIQVEITGERARLSIQTDARDGAPVLTRERAIGSVSP